MPEGVPDFAQYVPGADTAVNASRRQPVRAVTVHTTQGNDSRGLGATRRHNSPGTFNFLVRDEALYCYYPAWVRCSHAAGSNRAGPGIENEGFTGTPMSAAKLDRLGQLAHWLNDDYGVPLNLYDGPRIAVDGSAFRGFVNHNSVATEPQYRHTDRLPPDEWARALGGGGASTERPSMLILILSGVGIGLWDPPSTFVALDQKQADGLKDRIPVLFCTKIQWDYAQLQQKQYNDAIEAITSGGGDAGGGPTVAQIAAGVTAGMKAL